MKKEILHRAVDLLSRRERSYKEQHQKLLKKDFDSDDIHPVLDYLIEKDYNVLGGHMRDNCNNFVPQYLSLSLGFGITYFIVQGFFVKIECICFFTSFIKNITNPFQCFFIVFKRAGRFNYGDSNI